MAPTQAVRNMTETKRHEAARTLVGHAAYLIGVAARAPSLHNTQPWRFKVSEDAIELYADASRQLLVDPDGREMLISCGAALYGLRLAVRSLGRLPELEMLPEPVIPTTQRLLARVRLGPAEPMAADERKMLKAVPHRHTHRGPFESGPLPAGLLERLQGDARAEGTTLTVIDPGARLPGTGVDRCGRGPQAGPRPGIAGRDMAMEPCCRQPGQGRRARARISRRARP